MTVNWTAIDDYKREHELSDYAFAKVIGISRSLLTMLRKGERKPGSKFVANVMRATGLRYEEAFICPEDSRLGTGTGAVNA